MLINEPILFAVGKNVTERQRNIYWLQISTRYKNNANNADD